MAIRQRMRETISRLAEWESNVPSRRGSNLTCLIELRSKIIQHNIAERSAQNEGEKPFSLQVAFHF